MRVAVTGTPGTGKTTTVEAADTGLEVVHLNDLIREGDLSIGEDPDRGGLVADLDAIADHLAGCQDVLVESHLAHHLDADRVIVLRCHPESLCDRLLDRGEARATPEGNAESATPSRGPDRKAGDNDGSPRPPRALDRKARENAEAEALDVVLSEAVAEHGREAVYEIDTTDRPPAAVAADLEAVVAGDREPTAGTVDFTDYL
jgi:adenylate kinase